jgi:hypothetical protein
MELGHILRLFLEPTAVPGARLLTVNLVDYVRGPNVVSSHDRQR